ncbi:uncharacterized protein PADG_11031 [Paracoccidioides brasiliensis Pb18]|uniref:Uncharacterized protein n=1 Tax=Paracoccidioides brasiliensis (strain Pb18) TaxID=502780 RepID=A0A0A0HVH9_PARBD|nr:uncharacterized protein PADG_11031 [Paracoccidioides brasiliensis Pb18]KGM92587.1 hypothetical protein PADG_11031 [Paracoccidioides brasiliensis Pb18]
MNTEESLTRAATSGVGACRVAWVTISASFKQKYKEKKMYDPGRLSRGSDPRKRHDLELPPPHLKGEIGIGQEVETCTVRSSLVDHSKP